MSDDLYDRVRLSRGQVRRLRTSSWIGLLLVLCGVVYLLSEFRVMQVSSAIWSFYALWPLILVAIGLGGLRSLRRGKVSWGAILLTMFGVFLFLHNSGLSPVLAKTSVSGVFWATVFIFIGLTIFAPNHSRRHGPFITVDIDGKRHKVAWKDAIGDLKGWKPGRTANRHWIGDVSLGGQSWVLQDLDVWHGIGDVRINLATALLEDRTYDLRIEGWIGDIRILVPANLPISADIVMNIGDVNVFEHAESGTGRAVHYVDPSYNDAVKRVHLDVELKIGDVQIVRV